MQKPLDKDGRVELEKDPKEPKSHTIRNTSKDIIQEQELNDLHL
jgi:hypothetical protein